MLNRYSNVDYVLQLDFLEGIELLEYSSDQTRENLLFQRWIASFDEQGISYTEFKRQIGVDKETQPIDSSEVLEDVQAILIAKGGEKNGNI